VGCNSSRWPLVGRKFAPQVGSPTTVTTSAVGFEACTGKPSPVQNRHSNKLPSTAIDRHPLGICLVSSNLTAIAVIFCQNDSAIIRSGLGKPSQRWTFRPGADGAGQLRAAAAANGGDGGGKGWGFRGFT
jgi:hypothetical protein